MRARAKEEPQSFNVRLMDITQLCTYIGLGKVTAREFAEECGAVLKIGRRCLYDKVIIDQAIDRMGAKA